MVARSSRSAGGIGSASRCLSLSRPLLMAAKRLLGQAALRGARGPVEFCAEPGQEGLPVGRQIEALVGLLAGLLPAPVIIDQVPERDVVAAVRQEQAAGAERVADREGERDLPDGAVELAVADQMGPPVRLDEAVRVIGCERAAAAGIQRAQALDGLE